MPQQMSAGDQARLSQWQGQFQVAQRAAQEPRRPNESPEQFQMRQRAAYERLRQLQTTKPSLPAAQGQMRSQPQSRNGLAGIYDMITSALSGGQ